MMPWRSQFLHLGERTTLLDLCRSTPYHHLFKYIAQGVDVTQNLAKAGGISWQAWHRWM